MTAEELLKRYEPQQSDTLEYERQLWQARFAPCGKFLIGTGYDATIQRWRVNNLVIPAQAGIQEDASELRLLDARVRGHDGDG